MAFGEAEDGDADRSFPIQAVPRTAADSDALIVSSFKATRTYEPIHTGGKVVQSGDGSWLVSTLNEQALVTEVETGIKVQELKGVSHAGLRYALLQLTS